jgi:predicted NUDIX family NTP pyrophosphohydrolase
MTRTSKRSAGLLMYRRRGEQIEVFLVHPGGPFFAQRDDGCWGIPKGLIQDGEELIAVGEREFAEETGRDVEECRTSPGMHSLGTVVQRGGKQVHAWAFEGDWPDGVPIDSNTFELEWPRGSGRFLETPEVDRGEFFELDRARTKINEAQEAFLDRLLATIAGEEVPRS